MTKFELTKIEIPGSTSNDRPAGHPEAAAKPLYAGVGVTDLAVEKVEVSVTEVAGQGQRPRRRRPEVRQGLRAPQPKTLQDKAAAPFNDRRAQVEAKLAELQADAKALPAKVQTDVKTGTTRTSPP